MAKIKVSHLTGSKSQTILLAHPDEDYWQKIVDDVSIRVLLGRLQKSGLDSYGIRLLALPASGWRK